MITIVQGAILVAVGYFLWRNLGRPAMTPSQPDAAPAAAKGSKSESAPPQQAVTPPVTPAEEQPAQQVAPSPPPSEATPEAPPVASVDDATTPAEEQPTPSVLSPAPSHEAEDTPEETSQDVDEPTTRDDLTQIKGIGPVFAERFYEAGITTYAALAELTAEQARDISQLKSWQALDPNDWLEQARERAGE